MDPGVNPESALESRFYNIDTNRLPRVVWVTNVVQAEDRNPKSDPPSQRRLCENVEQLFGFGVRST